MIESVKPDDRSVITYVSCFFHLFAEAEKVAYIVFRLFGPIYRQVLLLLE